MRLRARLRRCLSADRKHASGVEGERGLDRPLPAAQASSEQYSLFRSYLDSRHSDGGMAHMSVLDYALMVEDSHVESGVVEYRRRGPDSTITGRDEGGIVACTLTDLLSDGLSMVYSFFDPGLHDRSLGTFMILEHIQRARKLGKPYVYLGYWVDGSPKMNYKARFGPRSGLPRGVGCALTKIPQVQVPAAMRDKIDRYRIGTVN